MVAEFDVRYLFLGNLVVSNLNRLTRVSTKCIGVRSNRLAVIRERGCGAEDANIDQHLDGDDTDHLCDYGCGQIADDGCHDISTDTDHKCDECGAENVSEHTDSATDDDHLCDNGCGAVLEACTPNEDDGDCTTDVTCSVCGAVLTVGADAHTDSDSNGRCDTCEYQMSTAPGAPNDPNEDKEGLGAGATTGIVIGSIAALGGGGFALWWFVFRKKRII